MAFEFPGAWLWPAIAAPFIGSFVGLVALRMPAGQPVIVSRSACAHCGTKLNAVDLVPLLSWFLLRGRCRHCHSTLGLFYPGVELAAIGVAVWAMATLPPALVWVGCALGWALLAAAVIDFRHLLLPDAIVLPLIPAGIALHILIAPERWLDQALGALTGFVVLVAIREVHARIRQREGLGLGDAKLLAAAGAWVGWQGLPSVLFIAALVTLAGAIIAHAMDRRVDLKGEIPFGPALALAMWLVWLYGPLVPA